MFVYFTGYEEEYITPKPGNRTEGKGSPKYLANSSCRNNAGVKIINRILINFRFIPLSDF
jgi:hypothetical protein